MSQINVDYFLEVVKTGNFTKAAENLYISQPSLSQNIKRLENSLGVQLFDRSVNPFRLTFSGERFYEYAIHSKELDRNIRSELLDIKNEAAGVIRLGIPIWRSASLLPDIFPSFHEKYPSIQLQLMEGPFSDVRDAIEANELDFGIVNTPRPDHAPNLVFDILCPERIMIGAPAQSPYVKELLTSCRYHNGFPVAPYNIAEHFPLLLTKPGQALTVKVENYLSSLSSEPDILLRTGNTTTAINLASEGMGCVFVPEMGVKVCGRPGKLVYFYVDAPELVWSLAVVYKRGNYIPKVCRLFINNMREILTSEIHSDSMH